MDGFVQDDFKILFRFYSIGYVKRKKEESDLIVDGNRLSLLITF